MPVNRTINYMIALTPQLYAYLIWAIIFCGKIPEKYKDTAKNLNLNVSDRIRLSMATKLCCRMYFTMFVLSRSKLHCTRTENKTLVLRNCVL